MKFTLDKDRKRSIVRLVPFIGIVLIVSLLIFNHKQQQQKQAELAYNDTKRAIELLITHLDRGKGKLAYLNQFEISLNKIYNH